MKILTHFSSTMAQVKVTIKTIDSTYFTEKVIFQRNILLYLFLPLFLLAMIPMLLFIIAASIWRAWDKLNLWLFSEKELISVEQARQRLAKNPFFENLTVTGVDDGSVSDGDKNTTVTISVVDASSDDAYDSLADKTVTVTTVDNDTPGVTGIGGSVNATEGGANGNYTLALSSQPTGNVEITVTANAQTQVSKDGTTFGNTAVFTFTTTNWNTAQTVTVKAIDDTIVEGSHTATITHAITTTADGNYPTSLTLGNVTINLADNDQAPSTGTTSSPSYSLIVQMAGSGTGKVEQTAIPTTSGATRLQLNAVADSGSRFVGWSGQFAPECAGTNPTVIVTVNAIKTCIATFEKIPLKTQAINFAPLTAKQLGDPDFSLSATATSGLTVTFTSATPAICTVTQNIVHLNSIGTCDVTAQQLGDNQYLAATPVSQSFPITIRIDANNGGSDGTHGNTKTTSQLRGISANGYVDQQPMIVGVYSSGKQRVLIRASGVFQDIDPKISLFSYPDRKLLASNDNWDSATSATELQQKQLAPERRTDAGILVELPEGLLTVEMTAAIAGVGLVEVYDLGVFDGTETSYAFKGFSVNAVLNDYPIIAGLLVTGENKRMLLRATGLETGIDPELEVFSYPDRRLLAANYRWATSAFAAELQQKQLLTPQQTDAATIAEFAQGLLTVELTKAVNSRSGRGIVEIYEMTTFK